MAQSALADVQCPSEARILGTRFLAEESWRVGPTLGIQGVILTDICIFDVVLSPKTMQLDMILMRQR